MKSRKRFIFLVFALCICGMIICFFLRSKIDSEAEKKDMPFKVSVLKAEIIQKKVPEEMTEENGDQVWRLSIQVKIENITEENFEDVSYELSLNEEAKPYVASGILKFCQDEMDVFSQTECKSLQEKGIEEKNGVPVIWALVHNWGLLLTTEEDLQTYHGVSREEIWKAVKTVTVDIHWDGGKQKEVIPLSLKRQGENEIVLTGEQLPAGSTFHVSSSYGDVAECILLTYEEKEEIHFVGRPLSGAGGGLDNPLCHV